MHWSRLKLKDGTYAEHTIVSEFGYAILRCTVWGTPTGRYLAFRGLSGRPDFAVLRGCNSAEEAKAICEADYSLRNGAE